MTRQRFDIISDTHGYLPDALLQQLQGADRIVHAGDICSYAHYLELNKIAPTSLCLGNNDWAGDYPPDVRERKIFFAAGLRWQVIHYRERFELTTTDIAICGHTHSPFIEWLELDGRRVLTMNPGSPVAPRRSHASMGRIIADEGTIISAEIIELNL